MNTIRPRILISRTEKITSNDDRNDKILTWSLIKFIIWKLNVFIKFSFAHCNFSELNEMKSLIIFSSILQITCRFRFRQNIAIKGRLLCGTRPITNALIETWHRIGQSKKVLSFRFNLYFSIKLFLCEKKWFFFSNNFPAF